MKQRRVDSTGGRGADLHRERANPWAADVIVFVDGAQAARLFPDGQFQATTDRAARRALAAQLRAVLRAVESLR